MRFDSSWDIFMCCQLFNFLNECVANCKYFQLKGFSQVGPATICAVDAVRESLTARAADRARC